MLQNSEPIKERLAEAMRAHRYSVLDVSRDTGIPSPRMYKWFKQGTNPKLDDAIIIEKWLNNLPKVPHETGVEEKDPGFNQKVPYGDLAKMIENNRLLAIANERYSGIIQEMWAQINSERSGKAPSPGEQDPPDQVHKTDLGTQGELIVPGRHGVRKKPEGKRQQKGS